MSMRYALLLCCCQARQRTQQLGPPALWAALCCQNIGHFSGVSSGRQYIKSVLLVSLLNDTFMKRKCCKKCKLILKICDNFLPRMLEFSIDADQKLK